MIHTFSMYANIGIENVKFCERIFNTDYILVSEEINTRYDGVSATISNMYGGWKLFLTIDVIKLLDKANINNNDYYEIKDFIDKFCMDYLGELLDLVLTRIEYRYDAILSPAEREFFLRRYKKIIDKYYFAEKKTFNTAVYHSNKSKSKIIYDKESERNSKGVTIESYEKNVLRYEVKLLNQHLYYNMKKHGIERNLKNYWNQDIYREYFTKEFKPILYDGDYYKLYDIMKILDSADLRKKEIADIRELLLLASRKGISEAKKYYSRYMFNRYLSILEELGVNPIVIPKNDTVPTKDGYIKNPLSDIFI